MPRFNLKQFLNLSVSSETTSIDFSNQTVADYSNAPKPALTTPQDYGATAFTLTPEGNLVAAFDSYFNIYNVNTNINSLELIKTIQKPKPERSSKLLYLPGNLLASNGAYDDSYKDQIRIWDLSTGNVVRTLNQHIGSNITTFVATADGLLIGAAYAGGVLFWDYQTGDLKQIINSLKICTSLELLNNGLLVADTIAGGTSEIQIWDIKNRTHLYSLKGHKGAISKLTVMKDGTVVSCSGVDKTIRFWNTATKTCIQVWKDHPAYDTFLLEVLNDGTIVTSDARVYDIPRNIYFLNPQTGNCLHTLSTDHKINVAAFAVLTDGTLVSSGYAPVRELKADNVILTWNAPRQLRLADIEPVLHQLKRNPYLVSLNFNGVDLGDKGAEILVGIIKVLPSLITLDLQNTKITPNGAQQIIDAVASHPTIQAVLFSKDALTPSLTEQLRVVLSKNFDKQLVDASQEFSKKSTFMEIKSLDDTATNFSNTPTWLNTQAWNTKLEEFSDIKDIILGAMKESIQQIRQLPVYDIGAITLQLDIAIINKVFSQISNLPSTAPTTVINFCNYSKQILKEHASNMDELLQHIGEIANNEFQKHIRNLSAKINDGAMKLGNIVDNATQPITTILSMIKSANNTLEDINQILLKAEQFKFKAKDIEEFTSKLFSKAQDLIPKDAEGFAKRLGQGFQLVSILAGLVGQPKLARQIAAGGSAAITIMTNMINFSVIVAKSGPLAPFVAIAAAISTLFSAFSSGPDPSQILLDQINELATYVEKRFNQVVDILKMMYEHFEINFQRLEDKLNAIEINMNTRLNWIKEQIDNLNKQVDTRFDFIEDMLGRSNRDTIERFAKLSSQISDLQKTAKSIKQQVDKLEEKIDKVAQRLCEQSYVKARDYITELHLDFPYPKDQLTPDEKRTYFSLFRNWALKGVTDPSIASSSINNLSKEEFCQKIMSSGISSNINLFADFTYQKFKDYGISQHGQLANPIAYIDAALTFVKFLELPEFEVLPQHLFRIEEIIRVGNNLRDFIFEIKSNLKFFKALSADYRSQLKTLSYLILDTYFDLESVSVLSLDKIMELDKQLLKTKAAISILLNESPIFSKYGVYIDLKVFTTHLNEITDSLDNAQKTLKEVVNINMSDLVKIQDYLYSVSTNIQIALTKIQIFFTQDPTPASHFVLLSLELQFLFDYSCQLADSLIKLERNLAAINNRSLNMELINKHIRKFDRKLLENRLINNILSKEKFSTELKELDTTFQLLFIYTIFAFQAEYKNDTNIAGYLQILLWNTLNFIGNLRNTYTNVKSNKTHTSFLDILQEVLKGIDEFEIFLEEKILAAPANKINNQIDPPLDTIIRILQDCKNRYSFVLPENAFSSTAFHVELGTTRDKNSIKMLIAKKQKEAEPFTLSTIKRTWAQEDLRDYIFEALDELSIALRQVNIEIRLPDKKFIKNTSKTGWQLFAFEGKQETLAVLNLADVDSAYKLIEVVNGYSNLTAKVYKSGAGKNLGIWIPSSVNVGKEIMNLIEPIRQEFSEKWLTSTI